MKHVFVFTIALLLATVKLSAQTITSEKEHDLNKLQLNMIIEHVSLDEDKQDEFRKLYTQYNNSRDSIRHSRVKREKGKGKGKNSMTDEQIENQILTSFEKAESMSALKKEYYYIFKGVMTPRQILMMYNIEKQFNKRLNSEIQQRGKGEKGGHGGGNAPHR